MEVGMGLFDNLGGLVSGFLGEGSKGNSASLLSDGLSSTGLGDLNGLVSQLQQSGLGGKVEAWMNGKSDFPISPQEIQTALGDEHVRAFAAHYGLPVDKALNLLSQHIPNAVAQTAAPPEEQTNSDESDQTA
jgi:uncharacterized protein YidB (DUF937 family)